MTFWNVVVAVGLSSVVAGGAAEQPSAQAAVYADAGMVIKGIASAANVSAAAVGVSEVEVCAVGLPR